MGEPSLGRVARGCALFLLPFMVVWAVAWAAEQGRLGSQPAAFAQQRPTTTQPAPTTTLPPPPTDPPPTTAPSTTTTWPAPDQPGPTYMPSTSRTWGGGDGVSGGGGGSNRGCMEPPGVTEVTWQCNGATWICHDKRATPGTYCIDP